MKQYVNKLLSFFARKLILKIQIYPWICVFILSWDYFFYLYLILTEIYFPILQVLNVN